MRRSISYFRIHILVVVCVLFVMPFTLVKAAYGSCTNPANAIEAENCLPGNPASEWDISYAGDPSIQGFATDISVNRGSTINFKIDTSARAYTIDIYRMGYYGGLGARKILRITPSAALPQTQPSCITDDTVGLIDCGNWAVSASWAVPANATSGIYFAHLIRSDTGADSHIIFIVRDDSSHSPIIFQTADETWQAYNYYGAGSLYSQASPSWDLTGRSHKVSYNRPFYTRNFQPEPDTFVFGAEFAMVQWLEQNGYDVTYFTGVDAARYGALIKNHKVYMDTGHDEYWSAPHRANVEAARDAGVNLAFFGGNQIFWKTRWENSIDGSNTPNRTLVCYKETLAFAKIDPSSSWTGTWRDTTLSPPADGGNPENSLQGTLFMVNGPGPDNDGSLRIQVPAADGKMRFWRNTAVASQSAGQTYNLPIGTLGYEWDEDIDNGFRPAGLFHLSTTTHTLTSDYLLDQGATYGAGTATHSMTIYRAASGALVFSAGTIDWSWGLNSNHDNPFGFDTPAPDPVVQQATVNLFADMGVQPATLQSGLVPATASSDSAPPVSTISYPTAGMSLNTGNAITVTGNATDNGGAVAAVEVSGDGGATWHPATGRSSWTYTWTPSQVGSATLMARAVDDSGNLEAAHGITLSVLPQVCPCNIWSSPVTPQAVDSDDINAVEVGVKFRADSNGSILGVRFYKAPANTGTHIGHVWSSSGALLGTVTFSGESSSGWQQANFSSAIPVTANTTYIVSYYAPAGHYSVNSDFFSQAGVDNPPLHALADGADGNNGVFTYGSAGVFPTSSYHAGNYWVDVVYTSSNTYNISGTVQGAGGANAVVTLSGPVNLSTAADSTGSYSFSGLVNGTYTITPSNAGVVFTPASSTITINYDSVAGVNFTSVVTNPQTISGTITGLSGAGATVTLSGAATATATADASGNYSFTGLLNGTYNVQPSAPGVIFTPVSKSVVLSGAGLSGVNFSGQTCNCISIWPNTTTPALVDSNDSTAVEVGVKFTSSLPGIAYGVRFYKASTNGGVHVGHLWTSTGTLLATATFTGETSSGWQQVAFSAPITITPNVTYVVSYFAPSGHYSADTNYFAANPVNTPPLQALANSNSINGVYLYSASGGFPTQSYLATNYWVDILFSPDQAQTVSGTVSGPGSAGATVLLSGSLGTVTTTADASGHYSFGSVSAGTYSIMPSNTGAAFVPATRNVTVGSANISGMDFVGSSLCPCASIWQTTAQPAVIDSGDGGSIETGVRFQADYDGYILGVRFYKAAANTGTHTGNLWSTTGSGNLLASSTFDAESGSGWQQVIFANPVPVSANTSYIASYFAPQGHYSATNLLFADAGVDAPPLHALMNTSSQPNGVFAYGPSSAYPTSTYNAANYWVDVIYAHPAIHTIAGTISGSGAAGATVTLSGPTNASTTADASGNFNFSGLPDGTYTISPSTTLAGGVFTPANQTITLNGTHALGVNFTLAQTSHTISGRISGAPNNTVVLSGAASATTTTDAAGNYVFHVQDGTYTVTPSAVGIIVTPASQSVTVSGADISAVDFTATSLSYTISGTIAGGAGATVTLNGTVTATTTADSSGNFSFGGLTNGSYSLTPSRVGAVFVPTNTAVTVFGANVAGANFTVPPNCPCDTIWQPSVQPSAIDAGDPLSIEPGVTFRADADGYIAGVRFYKAPANTGQHRGNLWSSSGDLLAQGNFTDESASGWQQVLFTAPVPIAANTSYVASYYAPAGHYSWDPQFFASAGVDAPPLHALQNGANAVNGVFTYGSNSTSSAFPNQSFNATNYWVDIIYTPTSTYSITGTVTGAGAGAAGTTVKLSGDATATTVSDSSGNFSFSGLSNGTYTISAVTSSGYTYAPATQPATIQNGHVLGLSFTSQATYTITGTISGPGGPGATVALAGPTSATVIADASGTYSFIGLANGAYTVAPNKAGYLFTPNSQAITVNGANITANFSSAAQTYTIAGTISGAGGANATVQLTGAATATVTANATGAYTFTGIANGTYAVTVSKTGYAFTPASQSVTVNGGDATANFSSTQTYTISGTISGAGGSNATVQLTGASTATATANASGFYTFTGIANGSYTITPSKSGYLFTPTNRAVTVNGGNATANFSSAVRTYTITGTISGAGGANATVRLTGTSTTTVTANASGAYTFTGVTNGNYTVTPSKTGYVFTPASQSVTVNTGNATANFSSAVQTYTITGTISGTGGANATVRLTGASTATVTANASGAYTFTGVANGSYTVTPSKSGYLFSPTNRAVTVNGGNTTANFSSAMLTYTITGTISGAGGANATVRLTGTSAATVTANASGVYTFTGVTNGNYTVTPSKSGRTFIPSSRSTTVNSANVTGLNFSSL